MPSTPLPLIALTCDVFDKEGLPFHAAGDKYVRAIAGCAHGLPLLVPSIGDDLDIAALLERIDGLVVTGATSNVHPPLYGHQPSPAHEPYDHHRDATTLALIRAAIDAGLPLFCICRGFQELNVVFGGTLATEIQQQPGNLDHRAPQSDDFDVRYGPAHDIDIVPGGVLHDILGERRITVNTVHRQAIAELGAGLVVEARAGDGIIEAVSVAGAGDFALGVQWHPEYKACDNPVSAKLFAAFGAAARARRTRRASRRDRAVSTA